MDEDARRRHRSMQQLHEQFQAFGTRMVTYTNAASTRDKRFLFEVLYPAKLNVFIPLIRACVHDTRCSEIAILIDHVENTDQIPVLAGFQHLHLSSSDTPRILHRPYDAAIVLDEPSYPLTPLLLQNSKQIFSTKRVFLYSLALYGDAVRAMFGSGNFSVKTFVDVVCVPDQFTKDLLCGTMSLSEERVRIVGSPLIDALFQEDGVSIRKSGRSKLSISDSDYVVLYSGFPSSDYLQYGGRDNLNDQIFISTLEGCRMAAQGCPQNKFVLISRTHPRDHASSVRSHVHISLPPNLKVIDGDDISYQEAVYAADLVCCAVTSTEAMLAAYRGQATAIFAEQGANLFGSICKHLYGIQGMAIIAANGRTLIDSPRKLADLLTQPKVSAPRPCAPLSFVTQIQDILFSD